MVEQLDLSNEDVAVIAELIDVMTSELVPLWKPPLSTMLCGADGSYEESLVLQDVGTSLRHPCDSGSAKVTSDAVTEQHLLSLLGNNGEDQSTVDSALSGMPIKDDARVAHDGNDIECYVEGSENCCFNEQYQVLGHERHTEARYKGDVDEFFASSGFPKDLETSYIDSSSGVSNCLSLSSIWSLSLAHKDPCDELKLEVDEIEDEDPSEKLKLEVDAIEDEDPTDKLKLDVDAIEEEDPTDKLKLEVDAIDEQFHQCFQELLRMRGEAVDKAKKRWMTKTGYSPLL